jgi:integrase
MVDKPMESWRARAAVSEALDAFNSQYMHEIWAKALARRESDPQAAVTSARTLLESVCKHILDQAGEEYPEGLPLTKLYGRVTKVLQLGPDEITEEIFKKVFSACVEIVHAVGVLRNHLSDAHGRGPFGTMPDWRHAELAVNLSGAMATYLAAVWKGRQPTIADRIRYFIVQADPAKPIGYTHRYALERLARSSIGEVVVSQLQVSDLVAHCEKRRAEGTGPATLLQEIAYLRGVFGDSHAHIFDKAVPLLRAAKIIDKARTRKRQPTHEEYDAIITVLRQSDKHARTITPMGEIVEFAVWSGRTVSEIMSLKWSDVNFERRTCKLPGSEVEFPVLERAWEMIESRKNDPRDKTDRIFPYHGKTASARHTLAKNKLLATMPGLKDLVFNDYRREAVSRLLQKGHQPHVVSRATGWDIKKVLQIFDEDKPDAPSS